MSSPAQRPPINQFLANSAVPMAHGDTAQSDWSGVAGPKGPGGTLTEDELLYQHLGPAHFGIAISPAYPDGRRVIWSNGGDRISKLDYETLEPLAELPIPDTALLSTDDANTAVAKLDGLAGLDRANASIELAVEYMSGITGVYYLLDVDNTLFVAGADSIIAYRDTDPADAASTIQVRSEWAKPDEITGGFVGANLTHDGLIAMVTNEGWLVLIERDFSKHSSIRLRGAEVAAKHNADALTAGVSRGAADWVRNSIATDENGGIYVASLEHLHKVVRDGQSLSTDNGDGLAATRRCAKPAYRRSGRSVPK